METSVSRILIVDDEPDILKLFRRVLGNIFIKEDEDLQPGETPGDFPDDSGRSYDLTLCHNGKEAVEAVEAALAEGRPFATAFIDLRMPGGLSGLKTAEEIRRKDEYVQMVIITGHQDVRPADISKLLPPPDRLLYLQKPLSTNEIVHTASALTAKWRTETELREEKARLEHRVSERTGELARINQELKEHLTELQTIEEALRHSEERYRLLVETTFDAIFVHDGERLIFVNQRAHELFGYEDGTMVGLEALGVIHPDDRELAWGRAQTRLQGETIPSTYEIKMLRKDGSTVEVEIEANRVNLEGRPAIQVWIRDITARKIAERKIIQAKQEWERTFDAVPDFIALLDVNLRIVRLNHALSKGLGLAPEDIIGKTCVEALGCPGDRACVHRQALAGGLPVGADYDIPALGGHFEVTASPLTDEAGRIQGAVHVAREVTARKRAEQALKESEEKYRQIVDNSLAGIYIFQHQRFIYVNPRFLEMFGYESAEEVLGRKFWEVIHPEDRDIIRERGTSRERGLEAPEFYSFRGLKKDGSVLWADLLATRTAFMGAPAVMGSIIDITPRHLAQEAQRASETRFRTLMLESPLSTAIFTPKGNLIEVNRAFQRLWGLTNEKYQEIINRYNLLKDSQLKKLGQLPFIRKALDGETVVLPPALYDTGVYRQYTNRDMRAVWLKSVIYPIMDEEGDVRELVLIQEDVSDRLLARTQLEKTVSLLRATFEATADGVAVVDLEGRLVDCNQKFTDLWSASRSEMQTVAAVDRHPSLMKLISEPESYQSRLLEIYSRPEMGSLDIIQLKDGRIFERHSHPQRLGGKNVGRVWTWRDATTRKRAEEALIKSEERYRDLFDNISDLIYTHDLNGRILTVNKAITKIFGYEREEALGADLSVSIPPKYRAAFKDQYIANLKTKGRVKGINAINAKDGRVVYIEYMSALVTEDGQNPYVRGSARDVTERITSGKEMKKLEAQLLQSQKMEAVGTLAGGVAHDFNNILTGILGNLELAIKRAGSDKKLAKYLTTSMGAAERAQDLTRHLLTFSRKTHSVKRPMSLANPIRETFKLLRQTLDRRISLGLDIQPGLAYVEADETQMNQVLMNLCVNSYDAVQKKLKESSAADPEGLQTFYITISAENTVLESRQIDPASTARPGKFVKVTVTDEGCGMDEATRARIFEPFYTTKPIDKGTGLGLSTVYGIITQHQGWVEVESQTGAGSRFSIYLPAVRAGLEEPEPPFNAKDLPGGKETILLVDDEEMIREIGREFLESLGYHVLTAIDGLEAVEIFEDRKNEIDLIILDMVMPRLSGHEVYRIIKQADPDMKILISSGHDPDDKKSGGFRPLAPEAFISKPYHIRELAREIRRVLDA